MLTFEPIEHRYFWNGTEVPSVSTVLKPLTDYGMIPADKLEIARQKGVAVHKMVELHAKGDLDEETLPEWMRPVLEQWLRFCDDTGFKIIEYERQVYHPAYGYAGTLDLIGMIGEGDEFPIIDVKRSFFAGPVIGMQTAAYAEAYIAETGDKRIKTRYALKLNETGPYRLEPFTDKKDFGDFITALAFHKLKEKHS
jgi:hypothetical protein